MTLTNHLKKAAAGLGLLGILAGCASSLPPVHNDIYARKDVSPQLKRSNALYDIETILADGDFFHGYPCKNGWSVDEQGIYCDGRGLMSCQSCLVKLSWEEVMKYRPLIVNDQETAGESRKASQCYLHFGPHVLRTLKDWNCERAEQLRHSIEKYLLNRGFE